MAATLWMSGQFPDHVACLSDPIHHVSCQKNGVPVNELDEIALADVERFLQVTPQIVGSKRPAAELQGNGFPAPDNVFPAGFSKDAKITPGRDTHLAQTMQTLENWHQVVHRLAASELQELESAGQESEVRHQEFVKHAGGYADGFL